MKAMLFAILVLSSGLAVAADWYRYYVDVPRGVELFLDLDSLHQASDGFEADIRLSVDRGRQEFLGRQVVNCRAATFRLLNLREARAGGDGGAGDEAGAVGADTALAGLMESYCVHWREPAEARWKAYATAPGETFFYDERVEHDPGGVDPRGEFPVYLKSRGEKQSLLAEVRISCRENRFAILSGVYRDEARGWLANIASGEPQTPAPDSPVAILRSMLCAPSGDAG